MAESEKSYWGFFSRLTVLVIAGMIVAIATRPYHKRLTPYLKKLEAEGFRQINFTVRKKSESDLPSPIGHESKPRSELKASGVGTRAEPVKKPMDKMTEGDKDELEAVLDRL